MTLPMETYERIWRETNYEFRMDSHRKGEKWNTIFERKVAEELSKLKERR